MSPAGLGEGPHNVKGYPVERGLYEGHGNEGVSDRGPRGYPLTLGTCLAMPFYIPLHLASRTLLRPGPGFCPCPGVLGGGVCVS